MTTSNILLSATCAIALFLLRRAAKTAKQTRHTLKNKQGRLDMLLRRIAYIQHHASNDDREFYIRQKPETGFCDVVMKVAIRSGLRSCEHPDSSMRIVIKTFSDPDSSYNLREAEDLCSKLS